MNRNPLRRVLVVDDEPMIVSLLSTVLREKGWDVTEARSGTDGIDQLDRARFDVIITDLVMPGESGIDLLRAAKEIHPDVEVILMTGYATADTAIEAMRNGAFHYLMKPLKLEEVVTLVEKAYSQRQLQRENRFLKSEIRAAHHVQSVVGDSEPILRLIATLQGIAGVDSPVLLAGELGTGRGFFARIVHFHSRRSAELCVPVYCSGVPEETLIAELFGAPCAIEDQTSVPHSGKMELANHGTLYLADFAEAGRGVLERIDRLLADKTMVPDGGSEPIALDVRVIASSAVPVEELARRGNVPRTLLKSLEPGIVRIPALREHLEDVPLLLHHFLQEANRERKKPLRGFTSSALSALETYDWPGNVRELRDLVRGIGGKEEAGNDDRCLGHPPRDPVPESAPASHTVTRFFPTRRGPMKATFFREHGGPDRIEFGELPEPVAGPGQVRVRVKAAALNHLDIFVRNGIPGIPVALPHVMGSDGAGVIEATGAGVTRVKPGDEVVLNPGINCGECEFCLSGEHSLCVTFHLLGEHIAGTFAEVVVAPAVNAYPKPQGLSWEESAAFPLTFLTAWRMLVTKARVKPGETLLIVGIGGGVAVAALQIAKILGLTVFVTSGSQEKLDRAKALGANGGIDHGKTDFSREIRKLTGKRGVDVVLDSVGKATWKQSIAAAAKGGRLLTCGATTGPDPQTDLGRIFWNQLTVYGSTMGTHAEFAGMLKLFSDGKVKPVVDAVFRLAEAGEAFRRLEEKRQFGKIVLRVD